MSFLYSFSLTRSAFGNTGGEFGSLSMRANESENGSTDAAFASKVFRQLAFERESRGVGSCGDKSFRHEEGVAFGASGIMKGASAEAVPVVGVGSRFEKKLDNTRIARLSRSVKGPNAVAPRKGHGRSSGENSPCGSEIRVEGGAGENGRTVR